MRLSTPIWTAFFNRKERLGFSLSKSVSLRAYARQGSIAPIAYVASSMSTTSSLPATNFHPSIENLTRKLDSLAPRFELQSGEIEVLATPEEFYATLRKKILSSKKRVFLSSLYIGKEECDLVRPLETWN